MTTETIGTDLNGNKVLAKDSEIYGQIAKDELFLSLKSHIDSQYKLNQLNQSRIRSFESFLKYCKRIADFDDEKFDQEQFRNEYNRFDRNDRYWRKRVRKLRKQTKSLLSIRYQNLYDILYELFVKIKTFDQSIDNLNINKKSEDASSSINSLGNCKANNRSTHSQSIQCDLKDLKNPEDQYPSNDKIDPELSLIVTEPNIPSVNGIETVSKDFEHSSDVVFRTNVTPSSTKKSTKKEPGRKPKPKPSAVRVSSRLRCQSSTLKVTTKNEISTKKAAKVISSSVITENTATLKGKKTANTKPKAKNQKKSKSSKKSRNRRKQTDIPTVWSCDFEGCNFVGRFWSNLKLHSVIHSDVRPFKCDQCELAFKYKSLLNSHQKGVHEGRRHECPFEGCPAKFFTGFRLRQHVEIVHTKDAPKYHCPVEGCSYSSVRSEAIRNHSVNHSDERPYKCVWPGCGKSFKLSNSLKAHLLMHKNERQYKCKWPECSYSCNTGNNLRKHHLLHEQKEAKKEQQQLNQNPIKS